MDCHEARELIDKRLHESSGAGGTGSGDWSALEAHLAGCPDCAGDWAELQRTRELLTDAAGLRPEPKEIETMWNAVATAAYGGASEDRPAFGRGQVRQLVAASVGIAAVLFLALRVGEVRYGTQGIFGTSMSGIFSEVNAALPIGEESSVGAFESDGNWRNLTVPDRFISPSSGEDPDTSLSADDRRVGPRHAAKRKRIPRATASPRMPSNARIMGGGGGRPAVASPVDLLAIDSNGDGIPDANPVGDSDSLYRVTYTTASDIHAMLGEAVAVAGGSVYATSDAISSGAVNIAKSSEEIEADARAVVIAPNERQAPSAQPSKRANSTKIIKTGRLTLEVSSYTEAADEVESVVREHGATLTDSSAQEQIGGALSGVVVIRVSPERFEALFAALKRIGRVESENIKAADVTADYVDIDARITSLKITEARLAELVTSKSIIDKMSALLEVEREMNRVRSQIEQLTGRLRVMADRIGRSTITLTLREPARTVPSATLSVEVAILDEAAAALGDALARFDGRLITGNTNNRSDGTRIGKYQLQTTLAQFGNVIAVIEGLGRVDQRQVNDRQFDDATAAWADKVQCSLALILFERSRELPTGSIDFEVDELPAALARLNELVTAADTSIVSNRTTAQSGSSKIAEIRLSVPAGKFATLIDSLAPLGRTTARAISGEAGHIVGGAAHVLRDLSLTLTERVRQVPSGQIVIEVAEFQAARERLSKLVADHDVQVLGSASNQRTDGSWMGMFNLGIHAGDMESVAAELEAFGRVESRSITGIGLGDLSRNDPNAMGVVQLTLGEKAAINPGPEQAGGSIRNRLRDGLVGMYNSLGYIAYGLIVMVPWLLLVFVPAWLVARIWRRRRDRTTATPAA